ncbi:tonB-system energizer ExbB [Rhodopseudomonas sp. HC1]|uniref:tonB-system energizer ExbB n=1 Tax=Rhodopseudomonas infernalis TaxID=2897386 RepID=UPI001EE8077A|nr:tonB-system energizer ExbB [Rhodopseudomonas infernalis]MCG6206728.1 tonB-system energizer ExbB [Rhodopseudomonas infernalis]
MSFLIGALVLGPSQGLAQQPSTSLERSASPDGIPPNGEMASPQASSGEAVSAESPAAASPAPARPDRRSDLPHDLSVWGMFMSADRVVKAVMIGLVLASVLTWTVCLAKTVEVACARGRARRTFRIIASADSLSAAADHLGSRGGPAAFMVRSAGEEMRRSLPAVDYAGDGGLKERVVSRLLRIEAQAGRRLTRGTGLLATVAAISPFVGLFGTVWGIMNSFIGISQSQTTNLAVVAPGIAEALLATAFGLVAAIPAVVIYNIFARAITGYRQVLADASAGVERLVGLDLDFRRVPGERKSPASVLAAE